MKKSVFRKLYAVKEERELTVDEILSQDVSKSDENEKSDVLEVEKVKVSRRKKGDE